MEQILKKHSSSPPLRKWNLSIHLNHQKKKKERLEESTLGTWNRRKRKRTSGWREKGEARSCWPRGWYWMLGGTAVGGGSLTSWQEHKETRSGGSGREEGWFGEEEASRCSASDGGSPDRVGRGMKETPLADPTLRTKASLCLLPPLWKRDHLYYPARLSWTFLRLYLCVCVCERAYSCARLGIYRILGAVITQGRREFESSLLEAIEVRAKGGGRALISKVAGWGQKPCLIKSEGRER